MDPIHPIVPHGPTISPIGGSPRLAPLNREGRRQPSRRDEPDPWHEEDAWDEEDKDDEAEPRSSWDGTERRSTPRGQPRDDDEGPGLHIDITV